MARRNSIIVGIASLAVFAGTAAFAQEQQATLICSNAGVQYKVGEYACIAACHGKRRLARCDALATSASWTYVSDACPSAMIISPWPTDWSELPAATAMSPLPVKVNMSAPTPDMQVAIEAFGTKRISFH
jgi:hypothetical protein